MKGRETDEHVTNVFRLFAVLSSVPRLASSLEMSMTNAYRCFELLKSRVGRLREKNVIIAAGDHPLRHFQ